MPASRTARPARAQRDAGGAAPGGGRAGLRLLGGGLGRSRRAVVLLSLWSLLSAAPTLVTGRALAEAVDHGFLAHRPATAAGWLAVFAAVTTLGAWAGRQTYPALSDIVEPLRDSLLRDVVTGTLQRAAHSRAPRTNAAAVAVAQITRQVEAVRDAASGQLLIVWQFVLTAGGVVLGTTALAPAAAPLVAGPLVAALCLFTLLLPAMVRRQRAAFLTEERLARVSVDALESLRDLVACGAQQRGTDEVRRAIREQAASVRSLARFAALRRLIVALGAHVPVLLILLAAPALVRGGVTAGGVVAVLTYLVGVLEPALRMLVQGVGGSFLRLSVAADRLAAASRVPVPTPLPTPRPARRVPSPEACAVQLRRVSFAYGPDAEPIVRDLSLAVAPGEHLAVVGPSGIGKSTLADLLSGVTAPDDGVVELCGVPLLRMAEADLHRARVLLPQDAYVFAGTVRENLGYLAGDPAESADGILLRAATRLGLDRLLAQLGGLDAEIDPARLSAGERQQIALARAYASAAPLVVLDEATSHMDAAAQTRVEEAFHRRPGTVITIAHRISSALRADRVLLLDGARPRLGTHAQLLADSPLYAELVGHWHAGRGTGPVAAR